MRPTLSAVKPFLRPLWINRGGYTGLGISPALAPIETRTQATPIREILRIFTQNSDKTGKSIDSWRSDQFVPTICAQNCTFRFL